MIPAKHALLSVAGFDPTAGAGILTDAAVFRALGYHPLAVLTSVAAQGSSGVREISVLEGNFIRNELQVILEEFRPLSVKIGMLYSREAVEILSEFVQAVEIPVVLDPIIEATSGGELIEPAALAALDERLAPSCTIVTPNLKEAEYFLKSEIKSVDEAEVAARKLAERWGCAVLLKGGHLQGDPVDFLAFKDIARKYEHFRIPAASRIRGTGCALSATIAVNIVLTEAIEVAVAKSIYYIRELIQRTYTAGEQPDTTFLDTGIR